MAIIQDQTSGAAMAVDAQFKAGRVSLRPAEVVAWQSIAVKTGLITGLAANSAIFSLRNLSANLLIIRRVGIGHVCTTAFTAAQVIDYGLMIARAFTASDAAGTAIVLTGSNGKHRTSLGTLTSVDSRVSAAASLTAGTKTLDANAVGIAAGWAAAAGNIISTAQDNLLSHNAGDHPIILAQNEGINIIALTAHGAAGVGTAFINIEFAEATSY